MRAAAAILVLLSLTAPAAADEEARARVAVLELTIGGDADPELRTQLERSLDGGLYSAGFEVMGRAAVAEALAATPNLIGCTSTTCLERIGEIVGGTRFVRAGVEGSLIVHKESTCDVCTIGDLNDAMSRLAESLGDAPAVDLPVALRSEPAGAHLRVDGKVLGRTPLDTKLAPGSHRVEARLAGWRPHDEQVEVAEQPGGGAQEVTLSLSRAPGRRFTLWKWAAAGAAVAALGTGLYLLAIDGGCSSSVDPGDTCPRVYDTMAGGAVLTVVGVGLAGASAYFFWSDNKAGAGLSGSF